MLTIITDNDQGAKNYFQEIYNQEVSNKLPIFSLESGETTISRKTAYYYKKIQTGFTQKFIFVDLSKTAILRIDLNYNPDSDDISNYLEVFDQILSTFKFQD